MQHYITDAALYHTWVSYHSNDNRSVRLLKYLWSSHRRETERCILSRKECCLSTSAFSDCVMRQKYSLQDFLSWDFCLTLKPWVCPVLQLVQ